MQHPMHHRLRGPWRAPRRRRREHGSVSLETAILIAPVLALLFGLVQGAVWYHARHVASLAAEDGVAAARVENADSGAGRAAALETITRAGVLKNPGVQVAQGADTVTVTVTGTAPVILLDWGVFEISQSSSGPRERITNPGER